MCGGEGDHPDFSSSTSLIPRAAKEYKRDDGPDLLNLTAWMQVDRVSADVCSLHQYVEGENQKVGNVGCPRR